MRKLEWNDMEVKGAGGYQLNHPRIVDYTVLAAIHCFSSTSKHEMSKKNFHQIFFYEFKLGRGVSARNIIEIWGEGRVGEAAVWMSNVVPDPDDAMEADYQNLIGKCLQHREGTPIPEDTAPASQYGDTNVTQVSIQKPPSSAVVNNPSAVDIETICQSYKGHSLLNSVNVARYTELFATLESIDKQLDDQNHLDTPVLDQAWVDQTTLKSSIQLDFLLSEYKKQKDEGVKMWTNWMEASIWVGEWQRVDIIAAQAERSIKEAEESESQANSTAIARTRPVIFGVSSSSPNRPSTSQKCARSLINTGKARLDTACALSKLQSGRYKQAVDRLLKVDLDALELPWLFSASDLAMYTTLCAIASYDRAELKKKVINDTNCRKCLESEPRLVELLQCVVRSQFGRVLDILREMKDRFLLDPYLSAHVDPLYSVIRERALLQYLEPFASADLNAMANVFRTDVKNLEGELVVLCEQDRLSARIDAVGATIHMVQPNEREENYRKIVDGCDDLIERCEAAILRAVMQQACISIHSDGRAKRKTIAHDDDFIYAQDDVSEDYAFLRVRKGQVGRNLPNQTPP
ncbi:unnamed protein product [Angiostrongylus costaricensis]|uniref:PCI domain-containing protein n=1 Tax=Angiostrongylus costaricensis TaxID=334426 RepID=A0A158PKE1_ANGCS|nr:unnamed protein product [Angiostrongylus costaricensis]